MWAPDFPGMWIHSHVQLVGHWLQWFCSRVSFGCTSYHWFSIPISCQHFPVPLWQALADQRPQILELCNLRTGHLLRRYRWGEDSDFNLFISFMTKLPRPHFRRATSAKGQTTQLEGVYVYVHFASYLKDFLYSSFIKEKGRWWRAATCLGAPIISQKAQICPFTWYQTVSHNQRGELLRFSIEFSTIFLQTNWRWNDRMFNIEIKVNSFNKYLS